jgi:integrase
MQPGAKEDGGAYSATSIKRYHSALSSVLNKAVEWELIPSNPSKKATVPKQKGVSDSVKCFTPEQAITFLNALNMDYTSDYKEHYKTVNNNIYDVQAYKQTRSIPTQFKVLFNIALYGGLRRGELIGLTWNDVDFQSNTININKSVAIINKQQTTKSTKTKSSERVIALPGSVMELLHYWKQEQTEYRLKLGNKWIGDNYIFIQWNGKQMHLSTPYHTFKDILDKYNATVTDERLKLPNIRFHDLRHTSATLLIASNTDIKTVSARLGHAQTSTTMNIYAHSYKKLDEVAADNLENIGSIINVGVIILNIYFFTKKEDKSKKTPYNKSA